MSDGNFNRALLPSTPYRSGLKAGEQRAMQKAEETFRILLKEKFPTMTDEELETLQVKFRKRLK